MMVVQCRDLWSLTRGSPWVDAGDLAAAIAAQVAAGDLDFRSRLLIRDSLNALEEHWGETRVHTWLASQPLGERVAAIWREELGEPGFPSIRRRIVDKTPPEVIRECLRELGFNVQRPVQAHVAGSVALILQDYLARNTDDIDFVNEVPPELRSQHQLLDSLEKRYGLHLGHVQSHYYPSGWQSRVHSIPAFGRLQVYLLDVYDVILGKLFSARERDLDDIRAALPMLDKETLVRRLTDAARPFLKDAFLRPHAEKNWYILFGEPLPT